MGGGGGSFFGRPTEEVSKLLRESVEQARDAQFETVLADRLSGLLSRFNARDTQDIAERLQHVKAVLGSALDGSVDTLFGGSVAKHTFVDGISDVDSLLILNKTPLADASPREAIELIARQLHVALDGAATVTTGSVAVTLTYRDGTEIQLVPTLRDKDRLRVPAWSSNSWSSIDPQQFRDGLSKRNGECGEKVIPTIKLAKAICSSLPEDLRPSGYHLESLAVAAFRGYSGEKSVGKMLPHLFDRAKDLVLRPMVDRTGQSVHVDESLGVADSPERMRLSLALDRVARRMTMATGAKSMDRWMELFGE